LHGVEVQVSSLSKGKSEKKPNMDSLFRGGWMEVSGVTAAVIYRLHKDRRVSGRERTAGARTETWG